MDAAIQLDRLTKTYGRRRGLHDLSLEVHRGEVFGYLGPNGAGKSTTIRLLLDLIRPTNGRMWIFGADPRTAGPQLRRQIGYLAGDFVIDGRQSARDCLTYLANLRGSAGRSRIGDLADRLELNLSDRIATMSKGNRQKVGLIQAFMHQPDLLILDEPSTGLDPLVQQTFLQLIAEAKAGGQTIFMSSHIMSEVERVADRVGIIREGRLIALDSVASLRARTLRQVRITFAEPVSANDFQRVPGVVDVHVDGCVLHCRVVGSPERLLHTATSYRIADLLSEEPDLEDVFLTYYESPNNVAA